MWGFGGAAPAANRMEDLSVEICEEARGKAAPSCVSFCRQASATNCCTQGNAPSACPIEPGCHCGPMGTERRAHPKGRDIKIWLEAIPCHSPAFVAERRHDCGNHASYRLAAALGPRIFGRRGPKPSQAEPHFTEGRRRSCLSDRRRQ